MILSRGNMKIAFDVSPMIDSHKSGVGYCTYGFVKTMVSQYDNSYILNYINKPKYKKNLNTLIVGKKVKINSFCFKNSVYKVASTFLPIPYGAFFKDSADITHFFNYYLPPGVKGKKIVTVHDMTYKRFPETVRFKTKQMLNLNLKKSLKRADIILTVSEFSKSEIITYFPEVKDKIRVVYNGVDLDVFKPLLDENIKISIAKKYNLPERYMLYLGTLEPRKNLERLIDSYYLLLKEFDNVPKLVLAGGKGWLYDSIFDKVSTLWLEDKIIFTGYVAEKDVAPLISGAEVFLFPSMYEGFGMPVIEAMACGVPVLTSNVSSLPEVAGDAAVLVDPFSVEDIKSKLKLLLIDEDLRKRLNKAGPKRAKRFSWNLVTKDLYEIYKELAEK